MAYAIAEPDERYRLAACTPAKTRVAEMLVEKHAGEPTLVIGQYLDQLDELAADLDAPVIKGETSVKERQRLFAAFRAGEIKLLVVSKVANFSIDLPEAAVAIQVSGSFGSRQEEAQRLGRLLRPKSDGRTARFYAIVARDSVDADFAAEPSAVPGRAGLRLPDHRRRRPVRLRRPALRLPADLRNGLV